MQEEVPKIRFSSFSANIIENLAGLIAERNGGKVIANDLVPYLPVSVKLIRLALDDMVDDSSVVCDDSKDFPEYVFSGIKPQEQHYAIQAQEHCISCGCSIKPFKNLMLCGTCNDVFRKELNALAAKSGWPAEAVYEHEILYLAAAYSEPVEAGKLAARSRYTLRNMKKKLQILCHHKTTRKITTESSEPDFYEFPSIHYPQPYFRTNMDLIRSYPSSLAEETEIKAVKIITTVAIYALILFLAAFLFHLPFPIMIGLLIVGAPAIGLFIWKRKTKIVD